MELVEAQAGVRAAAKAATLVRQLPQPLGFSLMILETKKMTFGLFLRNSAMTATNDDRISEVGRPSQTSLVAKCMSTMSGASAAHVCNSA